MAEQLQVSMETVGLGFSRKPHLCAGITVRETNPVRIPSGPAGLTFREGRGADIWYNRRCIVKSRDIRKEILC
jgi:hypothetical protein